jgi:hypothetical protein
MQVLRRASANRSSPVQDIAALAVVQGHQAAGVALSAMAVRPPGTWRYSVEELHPTCRATSEAVMVPDASIAFAALTWMASNAGGRPPIRPRARLAASAVRVRSRRSSISNCPRAAKIWRISRPVALVVSMFSCSDPQTNAACLQGVHGGQKLAHGSRQTVEPGDDQHITLAGKRQRGGKLRAIRSGAARSNSKHVAPVRQLGQSSVRLSSQRWQRPVVVLPHRASGWLRKGTIRGGKRWCRGTLRQSR